MLIMSDSDSLDVSVSGGSNSSDSDSVSDNRSNGFICVDNASISGLLMFGCRCPPKLLSPGGWPYW